MVRVGFFCACTLDNTLTVKGSSTVQLTSCLTGLDLSKPAILLLTEYSRLSFTYGFLVMRAIGI